MSLSNIKNSIKSISVLEKATFAMRLVAISTGILLKKEIIIYENLFDILNKIKSDLNINFCDSKKNVLYIFIGSEKGLCGSYNIEIEKKAKEILEKNNFNDQKNYFVFIGKKFASRFHKYLNNDDKIVIFQVFKKQLFSEINNLIYKHIISKNISKIIFLYTKSKNLFINKVIEEEFYFDYNLNLIKNNEEFYDEATFNNFYIKKLFEYTCMKIFFNACISEQNYRFIAMDKANRNALKQKEEKQIFYNKERQNNITKELQGLFNFSDK